MGRPDQSDAGAILEARYRELFENSADAILIIKDEVFIDCNAAAVEMLGYPDRAALLRTHPSEISPEFQPDGQRSFDKANEHMQRAIEVTNHRFEWVHTRANGETFPVEVLLTAIMTDDDDSPIIHTVWRDISERKRLENELRHSQKMDVVGKLAGGVAHDFNNQLVPILGYSDLLVNALNDQPRLREWAQEIHRASTYASTLVNKLLAFSRKEASAPVALDLCSTIQELMGILRKLIGENIAVDCDVPAGSLWIRADDGDLEQILLNLAANARDALPKGGLIHISVEPVETDPAKVRLRVADNGIGMDDRTKQKIFEPFFTTKPFGSGTGLGLSTVHELVAQANGTIYVESSMDRGTTVDVILPLLDDPSLHPGSAEGSGGNKENNADGAEILVVEDDIQVARFIERVLTEAGYGVTVARDGGEALPGILKSPPDLILTDVIMSTMSGPAMVQQLRTHDVAVPVIFMSGYTDDRLKASGFDPQTITLIRKPFTARELMAQIQVVLDDSSEGKLVH